MNKRIILVGDVHGCIEELDSLLKLAEYRQDDRLVFLGDLIDRGPDPVGCVRRARELHAEMVLGNHEEKALRWRRYEAERALHGKPNPMRPPRPERRAEWEALSVEDLDWIAKLPVMIHLDEHWIAVHGGLEPGRTLAKQKKDRVIRVRYVNANGEMVPYKDDSLEQPEGTVYWTELWEGPKSVVYGHAVHSLDQPREDLCGPENQWICVGLDTGCVFGGRLTCMIINDGPDHFCQVPAKKMYHPPLAC